MTPTSEVDETDIDEILKPVQQVSNNPFVENINDGSINTNDVYEISYNSFVNKPFTLNVKFNDFDGTLISFTDLEADKPGALMPSDIISSKLVEKAPETKQTENDNVKQNNNNQSNGKQRVLQRNNKRASKPALPSLFDRVDPEQRTGGNTGLQGAEVSGPDGTQQQPTGRKYRDWETDRKSTRLNSSHSGESRMPSSA